MLPFHFIPNVSSKEFIKLIVNFFNIVYLLLQKYVSIVIKLRSQLH